MKSDDVKTGSDGLVESTIEKITYYIRANCLAPGDKLPSETFFASEYGVSRSVVREAYRSLCAMRLINVSAGKRATVAQLDDASMSLMIQHGVITEQISVQQIYDVRRTIEVRTVALAALRRNSAEAETILHHAQEMKRNIDDAPKVLEHDLAFHLAIAKASKNPVFQIIVGAFQGVIRESWQVGWRNRPLEAQRLTMAQTHIDIADAIASEDPQEASALMARHFDDSVRVLLDAGLI